MCRSLLLRASALALLALAAPALGNWWTPENVARFMVVTDKVVAQHGAYEPLRGKKINGELTPGENMGDLVGINIAHDAWKLSLNGKTLRPSLAGPLSSAFISAFHRSGGKSTAMQ